MKWSQAPCLMTSLPAVPAMTPPAGGILLGAPSGVSHAVVLTVVLTVALEALLMVVLTVVLEGALIVRDSAAAVRCWRRGSRDCLSQRSLRA
jgi:hypothetical protein